MINGTIFQCFHRYTAADSRLWMQLAQRADDLAKAGFTAVWLPPMTKSSGGSSDLGYSAYDLYDLGEFNQCGSVATGYGTRTQLLAAIARLQSVGLQVYGDVVLHRKHGGDRPEAVQATPVSWQQRQRDVGPPQSVYTHSGFTFPGRGDRYNAMTWNHEHFQLINHTCGAPDNAINSQGTKQRCVQHKEMAAEKEVRHQYGLYRIKPASSSAMSVDVRFGTLRDHQQHSHRHHSQPSHSQQSYSSNLSGELVCELDLAMPEVAQAIEDWGRWLLKTTGINGLRIDSAKYVPAGFLQNWLVQLRVAHRSLGLSSAADESSLFMMGDYWSDQMNDLRWYIAQTGGQLSLFDVPLHYHFHRASRQGDYYDLRTLLTGTLVKQQPALAVTFVENHNSQPKQLLSSPVEEWFKPLAYALILLRQEGYPCVFAADYYGVDCAEAGWLPSHRWLIEKLMWVRQHLAYGPQQDYFERPNLIGWTRLGDERHSQAIAVLISNGSSGQQWMKIGKPNRTFTDITQNVGETIRTNEAGWGHFSCGPRSVSVWVEKEKVSP